MKISDEIHGLRKHIQVPEELEQVRWAARPRGSVGLGPTDLELLALFPLDDEGLASLLGSLGPAGPEGPLGVPAELLEAVGLPGSPSPTGASLSYSAFENIRWTCVGARQVDGGVLVYLTSR